MQFLGNVIFGENSLPQRDCYSRVTGLLELRAVLNRTPVLDARATNSESRTEKWG
jgi:hypothetical protein